MNYCQKCKKIYNDKETACLHCKKGLKPIENKNTPVAVCTVSGVDRMRVHAALNDAGIPTDEVRFKKSISSEAITGGDLADVIVTVPYQAYDKAFDICVGIGVIGDSEVPQFSSEDVKEQLDKDMDDFQEMTSSKRTAVRIISAFLLILIFCGVIWGTDYVMEIIKGLF